VRDAHRAKSKAHADASCSAEKIKEDYTYVCQDIVKEFKKYDADPYKYFARFSGEHSVTGRVSVVSPSSTDLTPSRLLYAHRRARSNLNPACLFWEISR
jgi:hypothetical protein